MIDQIHVRNVALIEEALLTLGAGLTVVTGETGAGKTALLNALRLLLGGRASADFVREGAEGLLVEGRFLGLAAEAGEDALAETVVRRTVTAEGRSRVTVDGDMASLKQLSAQMAGAVDICGQHDQQKLLKPACHLGLLDAWAPSALSDLRHAYGEAYAAAKDAAAQLQHVLDMKDASSAQLEDARFVLRRIDEVNPKPGEYDELMVSLGRAENAEALARAAQGAALSLSGEDGALDALGTAAAALESASRFDESLTPYAASLREASYVVEDVARDIRGYASSIDFDAETLAAQQQRAAAIQGLIRAYGPRFEDVLQARSEAADLVSAVDSSAEREEAARKAVDAAEAVLAQAADALHAARVAAAPEFAQAVSAQMARLEMGSASLECQVDLLERSQWTPAGPSAVEFLFKPGADMQPRPLARIASGGEISRVMLALHVVMGAKDNVATLVFDEVDAGVGGTAAVALADVLAVLAQTHQVLVVTHLPQVAVRAQCHYVVEKQEHEGVASTSLSQVEGDTRVAEVARMLAGSSSEASLAHARELLLTAS